MSHRFDSAYSRFGWRHQIVAWTQAGYRVVAPNMLGYGRTEKPRNVAAYTTMSLAADLAALLDVLGIAKAVVVGHDWGAATVWRFALYHPQRIMALVVYVSDLLLLCSAILTCSEDCLFPLFLLHQHTSQLKKLRNASLPWDTRSILQARNPPMRSKIMYAPQ